VAPAATITKLLPAYLAAPIIALGLPVSDAEFVGLALLVYGKDREGAPFGLMPRTCASSGCNKPRGWSRGGAVKRDRALWGSGE
jgi:hypothetical protein